MLPLTLLLLALAILCGVLGYGGVAVPFATLAQILFVVFVVLFLITAVAGAFRNRPSADS
jgi:uncharacterized membrane protein YtjA (UPF0391 family)